MIKITDKYAVAYRRGEFELIRTYKNSKRVIGYFDAVESLLRRVPVKLSDVERIRLSRECDALRTGPQAKLSQPERLLKFYQSGGEITALEAAMNFGITQLAARHCELEKRGHSIESEWITTAAGKKIKSYYMQSKGAQ